MPKSGTGRTRPRVAEKPKGEKRKTETETETEIETDNRINSEDRSQHTCTRWHGKNVSESCERWWSGLKGKAQRWQTESEPRSRELPQKPKPVEPKSSAQLSAALTHTHILHPVKTDCLCVGGESKTDEPHRLHSTTQHGVGSRTKAKSGQFTDSDSHCGQTISGNFSSFRWHCWHVSKTQTSSAYVCVCVCCLCVCCLCVCVCVQSCRHTLTPFVCIFFGCFCAL